VLFSVLFVNHYLLVYVMAPACAIIIESTAWDKKFHGQAHFKALQDDGSIKKEIFLIETG
jgi:hypothetical protein